MATEGHSGKGGDNGDVSCIDWFFTAPVRILEMEEHWLWGLGSGLQRATGGSCRYPSDSWGPGGLWKFFSKLTGNQPPSGLIR